MDLLNEARAQLESVVDDDLLKEYFAILRPWFLLNSQVTVDEFDRQARKLLLNEEQVIAHDRFIRALLDKTRSDKRKSSKSLESVETTKSHKNVSNKESDSSSGSTRVNCKKGSLQQNEFTDYLKILNPPKMPLNEGNVRLAAKELFMPDHALVSMRVVLVAWENGLQKADDNVTDLIMNSCQIFVKNILTAMISRIKGYKLRDNKFQYGFNHPIADPFLRNYGNIVDLTRENEIDVRENDDSFVPPFKPSLETMEYRTALGFSTCKRRKIVNSLTIKLLYDTLKDNPRLLGSDSYRRDMHLLKLNLLCDESVN